MSSLKFTLFGSFIKHILLASRVHYEVGFKASERKAILQQPSLMFARTNIFSESKMCYFFYSIQNNFSFKRTLL